MPLEPQDPVILVQPVPFCSSPNPFHFLSACLFARHQGVPQSHAVLYITIAYAYTMPYIDRNGAKFVLR